MPKTTWKRSPLERDLELQLKSAKSPSWQAEFRFDAKRRWRFDFAWPEKAIAVEVMGGTWRGGRHTRGAGYEQDCEKSNAAQRAGWRVFKYTSRMVKSGHAAKDIMEILNAART